MPEDLCRTFRSATYKLLVLLVIVDLVFIFLNILNRHSDLIHGWLFLISHYLSYAEFYQYMKEFWVVILLLYLLIKRPSYLLLAWFLIFAYILFDDALRMHEQFGAVITNYFGFTPALGLPGRQFGEFAFAAIVGTMILIVLGTSYYLNGRIFKSVSNSLLFLLAAFFFFSVLMDAVNDLVRHTVFNSLITVVEDGGEMLVMSVITWYVFYLDPESMGTDLESKLA